MKKIVFSLILLLLFPCITLADTSENTTSSVPTTTNNISESPDTGVEDYFITLGIVSVILFASLEIMNKKNVFQKI